MRFFIAVLPLFKDYVLLFQSNIPLFHKVNEAQDNLFRNFLGYFVKCEFFNNLQANELLALEITDEKLETVEHIFYGVGTRELMNKFGFEDTNVKEFTETVNIAYKETVSYLQKKIL